MARSSKADPVPIVRLTIRAKPRASRTRILRVDGLNLEAALAAPPVDGAANAELIELLATALSLPKSALRLALGLSAKHKVVEVFGLDQAEVIRRLQTQ
jgi:uncharacterized protein YggU (UPF0235/DUF167 family)